MTAPAIPVPDRPAGGWQDWIPAIVLVAVLYGAMAGTLASRFETMDDVAMAMWSSGLCLALEPQSHIVFSHEFIGWILKHLHLMWPAIGWYGWLQAVVLCASSVVVCQAFKRIGGWLGVFAFLGYFVLTQVDAFVLIQFTKTAFYATLAGALLLALANTGARLNRPLVAGATLFALVGSLIRPESFVFAVTVCVPPLVVGWWCQRAEVAPPFKRRLMGLGIFLGVPFFLILTTSVVDRLGPWKQFYDYRMYRSQALDFGGRITYDENKHDAFDQIHWSRNDFAMTRQSSYFDPEIFSAENYRHLLEAFPQRWQIDNAWAQSRAFLQSLRAPAYAITLVAGGLILIVGFGRRNAWAMATVLLSVSALLLGILLLLKWPPHRVILPAFGCAYCGLVWHALQAAQTRWRRSLLATGCAAAFVVVGFQRLPAAYTASRLTQRDSAAALQELTELHSDRSQLYFTWSANFPYEQTFHPFNYHRELFEDHLQVGSWALHHPTAEAMLHQFGVTQPYVGLVNNPHLFLIAAPDGVTLYRRFMQEHYGRDVEVLPVKSGAYLRVWRVTERKNRILSPKAP
ncbi:MAG: hypothetical protein JWM32_742 [Verrucomicrobia bacterium]|nr:hypothetical protein [Verrucomicrobiota bacterium]